MSAPLATPTTLPALLKAALPGDVVTLAAGDYPALRFAKRVFPDPLVIDASAARITGLWYWSDVEGVTFRGGTWLGLRLDKAKRIRVEGANLEGPPDASGFGVKVLVGEDISVLDSQLSRYKSGVELGLVSGFEVTGNRFRAMRADGMTVGECRKGLIAWNDFAGTVNINPAEHPDAIQLFSRPTSLPTADVVIEKNRVRGQESQGISLFNHVRDGVDDGGFDRITIQDNDVCVGFPQAVAVYSGRDCIVRRNRVSTWPGAKFQAKINIDGGSGLVRSGNTVGAGAGRVAVNDPA